jgi:lipid-binding SYLF domain-containing protein
MTRAALESFLRSKGWSLEADAGIAVTSKGAAEDFDSHELKKPVLVYVFNERGLMADLSLQGSKINRIDK